VINIKNEKYLGPFIAFKLGKYSCILNEGIFCSFLHFLSFLQFMLTFCMCLSVPWPQMEEHHIKIHSTKHPGSIYQHSHHALHFPLHHQQNTITIIFQWNQIKLLLWKSCFKIIQKPCPSHNQMVYEWLHSNQTIQVTTIQIQE